MTRSTRKTWISTSIATTQLECRPGPMTASQPLRRCAPLERIPTSGPGGVSQDGVDDVGLRVHRDDLRRRPARGAQERVDLEDAPQQSRPTGPGGRRAWLGVRVVNAVSKSLHDSGGTPRDSKSGLGNGWRGENRRKSLAIAFLLNTDAGSILAAQALHRPPEPGWGTGAEAARPPSIIRGVLTLRRRSPRRLRSAGERVRPTPPFGALPGTGPGASNLSVMVYSGPPLPTHR
jgi:hypothetical protein